MSVVTRFAPSPTGALHIGVVRTALFCWLYARANDGRFLLRIEDTDRARSTPEAVAGILDGLAWLGITSDREAVYQTRRFDRYREVLRELLRRERAYHCYCTPDELAALRAEQMARGEKPRYDRRCLRRAAPPSSSPEVKPVVRFLNDEDGEVVFTDLVHGTLRFNNRELDDLIIARSDGSPTYNFTVVVDDLDMEVSHVIRGDDHINNTPRQLNILRALDAPPPQYAHLPMIRGADGRPLSKRHGALGVLEYRRRGYLPEALLNYLVRLGWSHGDREVFSMDEVARLFDLAGVHKAAATYDAEKLRWFNQHYIKQRSAASLVPAYLACLRAQGVDDAGAGGPPPQRVLEAYRERAVTLEELARSTLWCYRGLDGYEEAAARKFLVAGAAPALRALCAALERLPGWEAAAIHAALDAVVKDHGLKFGRLAQAVRLALTGGTASPPIDVTLVLCGRERAVQRIGDALQYVSALATPDCSD